MPISRTDLVARLAGLLSERTVPHTLRVAVDGPDAAGKTTLADELARALRRRPALVAPAGWSCWSTGCSCCPQDCPTAGTLYRALVGPAEVADVVVATDDPGGPVIRKWPR